jgi:hydrogenase small subunit
MGEFFDLKYESAVDRMAREGVSRRDFMKFCTAMAAALALPASMAPKIAEAIETRKKPVVVWLEFQDCCGNTESFLRASKPTVAEIVLDVLSVDYHETIMAAAGHQAHAALDGVVKNLKGQYIAIVEGSIPMKDGGVYCCIGGRSAIDIAKTVCGNALATIAVGNCAWDGGLPAAAPNPTGAVGVGAAVPGVTLINLPGCPMNAENLTAVVVHFLTFGTLPACDSKGRPLFAYGKRIHDNCERRAHFDAGQYVRAWGDEGHRKGWCLYEMGCKGPSTFANCPTMRFNEKTGWPVQAGHGCIGCASDKFWDTATPFYRRLPNVPGFGADARADKIGVGVVGAAAGAVIAHGIGRLMSGKKDEAGK